MVLTLKREGQGYRGDKIKQGNKTSKMGGCPCHIGGWL